MSVKKLQKNNTYIDISDNSVFEIKLFLYELRKRYKFLSINLDTDKEIQENRLTIVINHNEKICYLENEKYYGSISIGSCRLDVLLKLIYFNFYEGLFRKM